jgi:hypothetical protein
MCHMNDDEDVPWFVRAMRFDCDDDDGLSASTGFIQLRF